MGRKKRTTNASHPHCSSATPPPDAAAIKAECERALTALRRGNHTKALRLMKESTQRFETSALIHRVAGTVSVKVASIIDDPTAKLRHLRNAIESAKKAVTLSPDSVEFACFYASLLYETAVDGKDFDEVMAECERALAIEQPIDPAKDYDEISGESSGQARIAQLHQELRSLIQRANLASLSSWMKGFSGEEKFRMITFGRSLQDPMESRYLQNLAASRRPNEIKKAAKTLEERRREIEVRVAAARLLQQKSEQAQSVDQSNGNGSVSTTNAASKNGGRRRHANSRRNTGVFEGKDQVRSFWNSMSYEMKRGFLRIGVSDLKAHFGNPLGKDGGKASEVLSEALAFGEMNKTWRFWACCNCGERFPDAESYMQHVVHEHMGNLLPKIQSAVPQSVDGDWAEMLLSCPWKPFDLNDSVRMLEDRLKPENSEFSARENHEEQIKDCRREEGLCTDKTWGKNDLAAGCNVTDEILNVECKTCNENEGSMVYTVPSNWPSSDDTERAELLGKIGSFFEMLLRHKYLATSHLHKVIQFTMEELQRLVPGSQILSCGLDKNPLCICFLGASQLRKIIKFLQEVSHSCGLGRYPEKYTPEDAVGCCQASDFEDRIMLNEDASAFLLDENLLPCGSMADDVVSKSTGPEMGVQSGHSLFSWIYAGPTIGEQLKIWSKIREERAQEAMEALNMLEKELRQLQNICDRKFDVLAYEEALQGVEELCLEESKKRENATDFSCCSFDSVLKKRRDELVEGENEVMFVSNRVELDAISGVLKEAENLDVNQFGFGETYYGVASHLRDLEGGETDWNSNDCLHQLDSCVEIAIQRQKEHLSTELSKLDARIMRSVISVQQLELKLEQVSAFDYCSVLLPLVKSFMQGHLEDLAEKDATAKSDAAREAFLAELALDSGKGTGNGNDNSKYLQEKTQDKRRNKDVRKTKDMKAGNIGEQLEIAENFSLTSVSDSDHVDADVVIPEGVDHSKELKEESRRKIELEAEERLLEETLEYQRRIENEAKQKLLAEQRRRNAHAPSEGAVEESADLSTKPGIQTAVKFKHHLQASNVFAHNLDGMQRNLNGSSAFSAVAVDECARHIDPIQGLPDGTSNAEVLPSGQQNGRKGKRRNSKKLPDGRSPAVSSEGENIQLEMSTSDLLQRESNLNQNGVLSHPGQVGITESLTACSRNMSSSKSKQRSSEVEESVDMDTDIPSEHQANRPIEIEEDEEATQESSQRKSHGKQVVRNYSQRAECWKHFDEIKENGKRVAGKCKYCNVIYKADPNKNGTKNLNKHFSRCSRNSENQSKQTQTQLIFEKDENNEGEARLKSWVLNPHEARASIAKMIIMDELPFRFVENAGFRQMMSVCCPTVNMPSRITVAKDIYELYVDERVKLKKYLVHACQRVCVTTDTWTSLQRINYMCVTAHFIDNDWKLHKKIINFCTISSHKGDDIAFVLGKCLEEWGLASKLYTVTVDNASSNNTVCTALIDDFKRHGHFLFSDGEFLHVRCIAHILNLIVWDGLKVVGKSVKRVRAAVRFIRQSPSRLQRFQECVIAEKIESKTSLSLDVPTRWNSTYKMLSTALVYEHVFTRYSKRDPYYNVDLSKDDDADRPPNSNDWKQVKHLLVFLEVFYNVTLCLSGTLYVTSNLLFFEIVAIHTMLKNLEEVVEIIDANDEENEGIEEGESTVTNFKEMAKKMKMKYDKYYGTPEKMNLLVYIAPIFDPRYKLAGLELSLHDLFGEEQGFALGLKVKQKVEALFEEYWQLYQPLNSQNGQSSGTPIEVESSNASHGAMSYAQQLRKKLKGADGGRGVVKTEMQKYLNEGLEEDDVDVLTWWKVHGPRYPVVARMARDVLAVPVSTVASESAFSAGGRTLDTFRTSLTPKMVQALTCAQDWFRPNTRIDLDDYFDELRDLEKDLDKIGVQDNVIDVGDTFNH